MYIYIERERELNNECLIQVIQEIYTEAVGL